MKEFTFLTINCHILSVKAEIQTSLTMMRIDLSMRMFSFLRAAIVESKDCCTKVLCSGKGVFPKIRNTKAMSTSRKSTGSFYRYMMLWLLGLLALAFLTFSYVYIKQCQVFAPLFFSLIYNLCIFAHRQNIICAFLVPSTFTGSK